MDSHSFQIISTLRYDPDLPNVVAQRLGSAHSYPDPLLTPYYLLPYHQDRLRNAARYFQWKNASKFLEQDLSQFARYLDTFIPHKGRCWRLRIVVDQNGGCQVEANPTARIELENFLVPFIISPITTPWRVLIDTACTVPSGLTAHKTTSREDYAAARARVGIASLQDTAEVLLVNPNSEIMEGSITTPYFRREHTGDGGPEWITPPLSSGGNAGTSRRYALAQGFCVEEAITTRDLADGEVCLLSNGLAGRSALAEFSTRFRAERKPEEKVIEQTTSTSSASPDRHVHVKHHTIPSPSCIPLLLLPSIDFDYDCNNNITGYCTAYASATMKFFENLYTYDYSFPAVSLAYFLRYPNPYSRHVLTTDVIDRYVDPKTHRLHTTRLHLKKSKVPSGILKLLPKGIGGSDNSGQSYILETTVVDAKEGWMESESRNMEWTGILSVVEKQVYRRQLMDGAGTGASASGKLDGLSLDDKRSEQTTVNTTVTFRSRFGQGKLLGRKKTETAGDNNGEYEEEAPKRGFFTSLSTAGIQRTIELIGLNRTREAILKSKQGMNVVLERLRSGGIVGVLDGMREDREIILGSEGPWKRVWLNGNANNDD
ncbi:aminotransferase class IV-domain-containing protein [Aspergillus unguis]